MNPTIFTSSPFEAHIIAVFMRAQYEMARFFHGTPVFRGLLFAALTWAILHQFVRIAAQRHQVGHALLMIAYRVGMVFLSISLMSWATEGVTLSSVERPWATYSSVQQDEEYADTLNGTTRSLWAYTLIYQAFDGVAQASADAAARGFNDEDLRRDPTFFTEQLRRMNSFALNAETQAAWIALAEECRNTDHPGVPTNPNANIQSMFDLTSQNCQTRWQNFQTAAQANGEELIRDYDPTGATGIRDRLVASVRRIAPDADLNWVAVNFALHNTVRDLVLVAKDSAKAQAGTAGGATDRSADGEAADKRRNQLNNTLLQMLEAEDGLDTGGIDKLRDQMAMVMPLIPAARGYVEGIMALLFVLAAYSVGFGTWKYLLAWGMAQASVCFYKPVALLGHKVTSYFMQDAIREQLAAMGINGVTIGGSRVLEQQLANIGAIHVAFELGAFLVFCVGAFTLFRQLGTVIYGGRQSPLESPAANQSLSGASPSPSTIPSLSAGATRASEAVVVATAARLAAFESGRHDGGRSSEPVAATGGLGVQQPEGPDPRTWDHSR